MSIDHPIEASGEHVTGLLSLKSWLEAQPFFLLGSSSAAGDCDCSHRGHNPSEPLLRVIDNERLVFPDYSGNNLFNTLGNLFEHPEIALLFVDFARQSTTLLQGRAQISERGSAWDAVWPTAPRFIDVRVHRTLRQEAPGLPHLIPA